MNQYLIIFGSNAIIERYLSKKKVVFRKLEHIPIKDLSQLKQEELDNGIDAWKACDNFIEGAVWTDSISAWCNLPKMKTLPIDPKTKKECGDWKVWRCRAYIGVPFRGDYGIGLTEKNIKGYVSNCWSAGYDGCANCKKFKPRTIQGTILILEAIKKRQEQELQAIQAQIDFHAQRLKEQS